MNLTEIKEKILASEYDFLRENPHLGENIILLTLGGSHAYGTNVETSDLDIRGIALNSKEQLLGVSHNFEQVVNTETDTTIYAFNKIISLLCNANPNTIELLGNKPEHYLYMNSIGRELLDNKNLFLSKRAVQSFGGYANAQLRRLENKANRTVSRPEQELHILKTIENASYSFRDRYFERPEDAISLYIDKAVNEDFDTEIFMDVTLKHYPLRDYKDFWSELNNIVKEYGKIGKRNADAASHGKLGKHMMHLIRLYLMSLDILEKGQIITYREKEHDLLMDIRNGKYLDEDNQPTSGTSSNSLMTTRNALNMQRRTLLYRKHRTIKKSMSLL